MPVGADRRGGRESRWLAIVSAACIIGWSIPALLMLDKGFAVQDEGSYVLSYRYWHSNPYFVSGSQYFYGPVFEVLGESIPWLRVLRLVMVIGVNAWFARCFLAWLDQQRPGQLPASRTSLLLLLTACGGMSYLWTPLTPGYYDLTADCSLALVALLLQGLVELPTPRAWTPCVTGVIGVALVVTKWTAFPVLVLTVGLAIWCRIHVSWRECVRYAIYLLLGATVALMTCQLFLVPLGRFVTIMWKVSSLTTVGSHGFVYLATHNLSSTASLTFSALVIGLPLVIGLFAARAAAQREHDVRARIWLIGAATMTSIILPFTVGWHGGAEHGSALVGAALAGLLVAVLAAVVPRPGPMPGGGTGSLLVALMFLVPFLQAAGTNVPLLYVAAECLVLWAAIVLMMVTRAGVPRVTTFAVLVDLSVLVVATAMIAGTTTLMAPFKTTSFQADTHQVPRLGVHVSASTARQYDVLQSALAPYVDRGTTPVITLDQMAGLTYLLGGVPAGSTWTDAVSPTRTAGILELACRNRDVPAGRDPVLIIDRPIDTQLADVMGRCGFDYPQGYRLLDVPHGPPDLQVFVPRDSS